MSETERIICESNQNQKENIFIQPVYIKLGL